MRVEREKKEKKKTSPEISIPRIPHRRRPTRSRARRRRGLLREGASRSSRALGPAAGGEAQARRQRQHQRWRHRAAASRRRPFQSKKWSRQHTKPFAVVLLQRHRRFRPSFLFLALLSSLCFSLSPNACTREGLHSPLRARREANRENGGHGQVRNSTRFFISGSKGRIGGRRTTELSMLTGNLFLTFSLFFLPPIHRAAAERAARREQERRKDEVRA